MSEIEIFFLLLNCLDVLEDLKEKFDIHHLSITSKNIVFSGSGNWKLNMTERTTKMV